MWGSGAGAESFVDAVGAHSSPLVVIAGEPNVEEIIEATVVGDVGGWQVRMVVEYRLRGGVFMVEVLRSIRLEQKVFVDEVHRGSDLVRLVAAYKRKRF